MHYFCAVEHLDLLLNFALVAAMTLLVAMIVFLLRFRRQLPHRLLSLFFASVFFFLLYYFGYLHRSRYIGGVAFLFGNGLGFLWGPLFLHYIQSLAFPRKQVVRSLLLHLIPFGINMLLISVPRALNMFWDLLPSVADWYLPNADYINIAENCFVLMYFVFCLRLLRRLNAVYSNSYSETDGKDLVWCGQLIRVLFVIVALDILFSVYELYFPPLEWNLGMIPAFLFVFITVFFAWKGMWQVQVLLPDYLLDVALQKTEQETIAEPQKESEALQQPGALSVYSEGEIRELIDRLYEVLEREKPFLNDSLMLAELAAMIPMTDKKLSELLNRHVRISFYDLINDYRVEAVKQRMAEPDAERFTLLALAFDSGFKSKTSFNRVFKQKTGMSPSQYFEHSKRGMQP